VILVYLFARKSVPSSYAHSRYVVGIKLKMVIAIIIPLALVSIVFGVAYWIGGLPGLFLPALALVLVLERTRASTRSEPLYALSAEQSPRLHDLVVKVSRKIGLKKRPVIRLCRGSQARTYGWLKAKIDLGICLFDFLTVGEVEAVVAHELGHVKDGDFAIGTSFAMVLTSLKSMVSACKQAVLAGGNILFALFMGIAGIIAWLLTGFVDIATLLFIRQGEFMADLHTAVLETEDKPTNFKRGLAKIALMNIAEAEFEKSVLIKRMMAVREGRFPLSKLLKKPHITSFYHWLHQVNFSISDEMIENISGSKKSSMRSWSSTHPTVRDRIHNLEVLMNKYPKTDKQSTTNLTSVNAKMLVQGVYDDAVKSLYGHESLPDALPTREDSGSIHQCSRCGKKITLTGKHSFFDTLQDGRILCQDCLEAAKS